MCYFRDLVRSKEPFQICRYFTATLQLVRQTLYSFLWSLFLLRLWERGRVTGRDLQCSTYVYVV